MAVVGAEVTRSWFLTPGGVSFFLLLFLLSIVLTALCSDCRRRSFELRDPELDRNPSSLIRVVKLEEAAGARENPMINDIQSDEKETSVSFTPWRSHLGATQTHPDVQNNGSTAAVMKTADDPETEAGEDNSMLVTRWRSHLGAPQSNDSDHIYHVISRGQSSSSGADADVSSLSTNQDPGEERGTRSAADFSERDRNSVYAQISKKVRATTPTAHTLEEVQVQDEQQEEEEASPPLPDRRTQLEG